ncbi:VgrG-related protein [Actinacidiphila bryophytorum]|uniref:Type IV secretion protein Rhs n=1 Tax=Actinacidiphila bryophytorum TaxID=1436133 RepID=A0A9W4H1G3_9ACTN|nr:VgrG-related protein [Actinacidiphila bryophytorum]MBM9435056.1 VgrG-related protein [Actinacidiphila bryophytorum]MBN6545220.1 VgrG-related protein [Actinacidiphila bryophytorum]CAG7642815.1 Type IV secretion protein Rhs [Actinacidiphila bryophytorum]
MAGETFANVLTVEAAGQPLPPDIAALLVSGFVDDSVQLPDLFVLRFRDPNHQVLARTGLTIGSPLKIYATAGDDPQRELLVSGEVTALEVDLDATGTFTVVRGLDHSHRFLRGRRVAGYRQMTASDVAVQVAHRAGLPVGTVDATSTVYEHLAQPGVSDWEFLHRLADLAGAEVSVADGTFCFRDPARAAKAPSTATRPEASPYVLEFGRNLLRCQVAVTAADQVAQVEVRGWDVTAKAAVVSRTSAGSSDRLALGISPGQAAQPFGDAVFLATDTAYGTQAAADQAAQSLAGDLAGSLAELDAVAMGIPKLRAGTAVTLANVGPPFEGKYTISSSRHVFDPDVGYQTWVTVSGRSNRSLYGLASGGGRDGGGSGGPGAADRVGGLVNATVTDTRDPEDRGRVRLAFPWLSDDYVSDWARTAGLGGKGGGGVFIPEVGDEVLVGFEQGRVDQPYVLGSLYNGVDRPSPHDVPLVDSTTGAVNRRSLVDRSGDRLELLDAAGGGPQGVRLSTGDGKVTLHLDRTATKVVLNSDGSVEVEAKQKVTVKAEQGVSVDAGSGKLELTGDSVKVSARSGVQVDGGSGALQLQTQGQVAVKGVSVGVEGSASTEIKGGATCSISAALVKIN